MCFFNVGASASPSAGKTLTYSYDYGSSEDCGLDKSTGIFTVKTEGLYHFSINIVRHSKTDTGVQIRIDQTAVCTAWSDFQESDLWGEGASCSIVRFLKPGQKIDAYLERGAPVGGNPLMNQFHGYLVK